MIEHTEEKGGVPDLQSAWCKEVGSLKFIASPAHHIHLDTDVAPEHELIGRLILADLIRQHGDA